MLSYHVYFANTTNPSSIYWLYTDGPHLIDVVGQIWAAGLGFDTCVVESDEQSLILSHQTPVITSGCVHRVYSAPYRTESDRYGTTLHLNVQLQSTSDRTDDAGHLAAHQSSVHSAATRDKLNYFHLKRFFSRCVSTYDLSPS